jgi:hypothetical protein
MFGQSSNYYDYSKNDDISIEPRLLEYIKKKKYYNDNDINAEHLDRDYLITNQDMIQIRSYLRGDKKKETNKYQDFIDTGDSQFPSEKLKKDPRFDRVKQKQQRDADAQVQRHNYGSISRTYDMYRKDRPFASALGNDFVKSKFNPNEWLTESRTERSFNPNEVNGDNNRSSSGLFSTNTYVHPKSTYNSYIGDNTTLENDRQSIDDMIGNLNSYNKRINNTKFLNSSMNTDRMTDMEMDNSYNSTSCMGNGPGNIDVDTYVRYGTTPSRGGKSLGYPNPMEHYFEYISNDLQLPEHVVSQRGMPSRSFNKENAFVANNNRRIMK